LVSVEEEEKQTTIIDQTETNLISLRRTIYLTIQSSLDFEECAHKLMKMQLKPGQEVCYVALMSAVGFVCLCGCGEVFSNSFNIAVPVNQLETDVRIEVTCRILVCKQVVRGGRRR
jgi:MA3 domain